MNDEQKPRKKSAVEVIAEVMGRPVPRPLTEDERREFWAEQDRIDEELRRRYGPADAA